MSGVHWIHCNRHSKYLLEFIKSFLMHRKDLQAKYKQVHSSEKHS